MSFSRIRFTLESDGTAFVILARPEKHNSFNEILIQELNLVFDQIVKNDKIRRLVLKSEGKSFCAGADLEWMKKMSGLSFDENEKDARQLAYMLQKLNFLPIPTLCIVQGPVYGGGVGLVACCDIVIASENANFCLSEIKIGLIPSTIAPYVVAALGARQARRYFLTAETFSAKKAKKTGLVHIVCDHDELSMKENEILENLRKAAPIAQKEAKKLIFDVEKALVSEDLIQETAKRIAERRASLEGQEGLNAFLNKRTPNWIIQNEV